MGQPGGAVMYGALGAAIWGTSVGCVSLVGTDYPVTMLDALEERRVDLTGVHRLHGPGVRTWLLYEGQSRRLIHRLGCPTHEQVSPGPEHIPPAWHSAPAFHLAPMPFAVQRRVLASLTGNGNRFVSIDPHLPVTEETLGDWRKALADADAFFPGEDELLLEGTDVDPRRCFPEWQAGASGSSCSSRVREAASCTTPAKSASIDGVPDRRGSWMPPAPAMPSRRASYPRTSRGFPYRSASTVASSVQASLSRLRERRRCSRRHAPMPTVGSASCLRPGRARDGSIRRRR